MFDLPIKILKTQHWETEQATITFDNIANLVAAWDAAAKVTSRHLVIIVNAASPDAVGNRLALIRLNGDTGANYNYQRAQGISVTPSAAIVTSVGSLQGPAIPGTIYPGYGGGVVLLPHAFNATNHKTYLALSGPMEYQVASYAGRWANVAAIDRVFLIPDVGVFSAGSTFHLGVIDERYLVKEIENAVADFTPTFNDIPQGEGNLVVIASARSDIAAVDDEVLHTINDDGVAGNYPAQELAGRGAVIAAASPVNQEIATVSGDNATANAFGALVAIYSQYTKGNQPHFLCESGYHEATGPTAEVQVMSGRRANIEPINKLHYEPNAGTDFKAGSLFSLYRMPKRIIERRELTAPQAVITFDNIPQHFEALILHVYARSDEAAVGDEVQIEINGDAGPGTYDFQELTGAIGAVAAVWNPASPQLLYIPADNEGAGEFGGGTVLIPGYAETDRHKHLIAIHGQQENRVAISSHRWESLDAVTDIVLSPVGGNNFMTGSVFELEGILRREGLPAIEGMSVG